MASQDEVVLRRKALIAVWWTLLGASLVASGVFFVLDTDGHPLAWTALGIFAIPAVYFLTQLVWPGAVEVRCSQEQLRSRFLGRRRMIRWDDVHVAKVSKRFGDHVLIIEVRGEGDTGRTWVPLPVGADLDRLHGFLRARLGRGSRLPAPRSIRPLDT